MPESRLVAVRRQVLVGLCPEPRGQAYVCLWSANRRASLETYDPHKNTTEVRQASPRKMNLRVLVISLIGIIVLFAILYMVFTMSQPNPT